MSTMNRSYSEVRTKPELQEAVDKKVEKIVVRGELAEKVRKAAKIKKLSKPALVALGAGLAATPFTGGVSAGAAALGLTTTTGLSIAAITAVAFLGVALILNITNGYDRKFSAKADGYGEASMELYKK